MKKLSTNAGEENSPKRYGDRDETIDHILSECSKLSQKD